MRISFFLLINAAFLISCSSDEKNVETSERPSWNLTDTVIIWSADVNQSARKKIFIPDDSVNIPEPIINGINGMWPEVGIYAKGLRNDTLIIGLRNEHWITDQIGNEGAETFLSFVAMNLLELKGVNHIYFDVRPGVHAGPDTWEDEDFADWKEIR